MRSWLSSAEPSVRSVRLVLWTAGAALGIVGEWALYGWGDPSHWVPDLAAGWSLIACGLVGWSRWPESRSGMLMTATGFAWFAGNFTTAQLAWLAWLSAHALYLYRGPLVELVLTYPRGRRATLLDRAAVAGGYVAAVVTPIWRSEAATIALAGCLVGVATTAYLRAIGRERRERLASWQATTFTALVLATGASAFLASPTVGVQDARLLLEQVGLCVLAFGLLAGLFARSWERAGVTDLVVELGEAPSGTLRTTLARVLGDPTLRVGYWSPTAGSYVDDAGRPFEIPLPGGNRSVTRVGRQGHPVAALVHDPAVLEDPRLLDAVGAASRLAASYALLQAETRAQLTELHASRRRLLETGDAERRRLETRLRAGAERRLVCLGQLLHQARGRAGVNPELAAGLDSAEVQLERTLRELRELAHGLHPQALTEHGLARALVSLAEESPVPVEFSLSVEPLPQEIEAAIYFVCSEALANVAKYASASKIGVVVATTDGAARVEVVDDGVGGADAAHGSGLRGLADRLEALGGSLAIESPPDGGTRVIGELPLAGSTA
jgi:signal transduction histidine kinase